MDKLDQGDVRFREFFTVVVARWRLVAYSALAGFLLATVIAFVQKPTYRASAVVQVEEEKPRFVLNPERQTELQPMIGVSAELEIVRSRMVLEPVIRELGLETTLLEGPEGARVIVSDHSNTGEPDQTFEYTVVMGAQGQYKAYLYGGKELGAGTLGKPFQAGNLRWVLDVSGVQPGQTLSFAVAPFEETLHDLRENLSVEEVGKQTNILRIAAELPDPLLAKQVVDGITQAYIGQNVDRKSQDVGQILRLIEQQILVVKSDLERDERELNDLKSARGIFVLSEEAKRLIEQISKMEMSRAETQLAYEEVITLSRRLRNSKDDTSFLLGEASIEDELITELSRELTKRLVEVRNLRQDFTVQNPRVVTLNAEIDELKKKIGAALRNVQRTLKSRMDTSQGLIAKYEEQLKGLPQAERELAALTRKSGVTGDLYSFLLKKHEEMRIAQAGIVGNLRVVEKAEMPIQPIAPKKKRVVALGLLAGLLLGVGLTFLAEFMDDTVTGADRFERDYGISVFGEIPMVSKQRDESPLLLHSTTQSLVLEESFQTLATNFRFVGSRAGMKRVVFASAEAAEGKTTSLVNLGIALSSRGARVLVIDCDLRRPSVHRMLGLREQPGLTNVLLGGKIPWLEAVIHVRKFKFDVLPAGAIPPNPAEILDSKGFDALLGEAAAAYDYVLLDVPPVLAFTDAAIVSARVDAVFVVAASARTRAPALARTLALLRNVQAPIRGAVMTFAEKQTDATEEYYKAYQPSGNPNTFQAKLRHLRELFLRA